MFRVLARKKTQVVMQRLEEKFFLSPKIFEAMDQDQSWIPSNKILGGRSICGCCWLFPHASCCYPCSIPLHGLVCITATRWWAVYDGVRGGGNHRRMERSRYGTSVHKKKKHVSWLFVVPADADGMWVTIASADTWKNQQAAQAASCRSRGWETLTCTRRLFPRLLGGNTSCLWLFCRQKC